MRDLDDRITGLHTVNRPPSPETVAAARHRLITEMNSPTKRRRGKSWRTTLVATTTAAALTTAGLAYHSWSNRPL